jgi:hypothetical protein
VYGIESPADDRASVFKHWLATDRRFPGWSEQATDFWDGATRPIAAASIGHDFEQLSLSGFGDEPAIG